MAATAGSGMDTAGAPVTAAPPILIQDCGDPQSESPPRALAGEAQRSRRVLLVARHPVGGIRTFFRYVYRSPAFDHCAFTLVTPPGREAHLMRRDLEDACIAHAEVAGHTRAAFLRTVAQVIARGRFDLVHAHGFTAGAAACVPAVLRRLPLVVTSHDTFNDRQFEGRTGAAKRLLLTASLRAADRVHCVSEGARDNLLRYLPGLQRSADRVVAIRNGVDVTAFQDARRRELRTELGLAPDSFLVGFLGRFMSQKGFRYLVDAVAQLRADSGVRARLVVLTFGSADSFIREEQEAVRRRGLTDAIRFLPFVPDVAGTLKGLDVVAMPSLWEACSLLAMETLVAGVPLIATDCVGLGELLEDTPARVVAPADADALARAIEAEMREPSVSAARAFAPEAARRFDVRHAATALASLLEEVVRA